MKGLPPLDEEPVVSPECSPYELMVHRLCEGDMTRQEKIWMMKEEDVYMEAYLRRVSRINSEFSSRSA